MEKLTTGVGGWMDKMSSVDSPALDLHGEEKINVIIIAKKLHISR